MELTSTGVEIEWFVALMSVEDKLQVAVGEKDVAGHEHGAREAERERNDSWCMYRLRKWCTGTFSLENLV